MDNNATMSVNSHDASPVTFVLSEIKCEQIY